LHSNDNGMTYRHTDLWEEFVNYAVKIGSGAMVYTAVFVRIGSAIQELKKERCYSDTHATS
jgi:hypothetical protein